MALTTVQRGWLEGPDHEFIETRLNFADGRYRGFRQPHHLTPLNSPGPYDPTKLGGEPEHGPPSMRIYNARLLDPPATLETHGFELVRAPVPPGCDLHEPDQAKDGHFYDYAKEVVAQATGCVSTTKPGRHEYRNGYGHVRPGDKYAIKPTPNGSSGTYGMGIHSDMSNTAEMHWKPAEDEDRVERHWMMVKVWRSADLDNNVETTPLAVCDVRTVHADDMIDNDGNDTGDIRMYKKCVAMGVAYSPEQRCETCTISILHTQSLARVPPQSRLSRAA